MHSHSWWECEPFSSSALQRWFIDHLLCVAGGEVRLACILACASYQGWNLQWQFLQEQSDQHVKPDWEMVLVLVLGPVGKMHRALVAADP